MRSHMQPVIELMAEIGFATSDGKALPEKAGKQLLGKLKRRYPIYERATDVQLQVEVQDDIESIEARCDRVSYRFLYRTNPPAVAVQLSPTALQLHFMGAYAGWETIQDVIEREWTTAAQTLGLRLGAYLSLRLVAHLPLTPSRQSVGYWIKQNIYTPESIRHTNQGYQCRVELTDPTSDTQTAIAIAPVTVPVLDALDTKPLGIDITVRQDLAHRVVRKHFAPRMQKLHTHIRNILNATLSMQAQHHLHFGSAALGDRV